MSPTTPAAPPIMLRPVSCPLCGHENSQRLLTVPDWYCGLSGSEAFAIARCQACSHVFMNPAPTEESIPLCYPGGYAPHRSDNAPVISSPQSHQTAHPTSPKSPWYLSPLVRKIPGLRALYYWLVDTRSQPVPPGSGQGKKALEIGCGAGKYLVALREAGWQAEGLDLVAAAVEVSRERGFAVHHGDLASYAGRPESFDGVFAWMVLEHVPHPRETLTMLHSLLKPAGCLGFSVPNYGSLERWLFGRYWSAMELPRHLQQYTPSILRRLLQETGFTEIEMIHQPSLLNAVGSVGYWLRDWFPRCSWGQRLVDWFFLNPPLLVTLGMAPWARLLAFCGQGGRLTVFAKRSSTSPPRVG